MTNVVYIVKPMNFASLKFSGTLRVLMAYSVQKPIRTKSKPSGAEIPILIRERGKKYDNKMMMY